MKGVNIKTYGAKLYFTRHAQSEGNIGNVVIDSPLSDRGLEQARKLKGHFDCVVISPLRRTRHTLEKSSITYDDLHVSYNFREMIFGPGDVLEGEERENETRHDFIVREKAFHKELEALCTKYKKILLIGHAYFFNSWYRQGCYPSPAHAEIIELICD